MLYSNNLLKRYISIKKDIETIADELTLKVCEVEEIHQRNIPDLVVVGKVTEVKKHPNADTLFVCQIDCGSKGTYQICTGGENVVADSWVPVALPGCYLPSIHLTIEPREMRGEVSNGMICSKAELGIPEDVDEHWIWTMQYGSSHDLRHVPQQPDMDDLTDADCGMALGEKYPRLHNWMIDVENKTITHRPDMFGHFGLSNELLALFPDAVGFHRGKTYQEQLQEPFSIYQTLDNSTPAKRGVEVQTDKVHTYTLLELYDVSWQKSDIYLRTMLYDLGLQPRANWIDFSNIFMFLTGQPVHFFDADKVLGNIIVRQAKDGEHFTDLFDEEHTLSADDVVIADNEKILALAGIIGSSTAGIDEKTTNILVEIANFDHVQVRKTATRLGLRTDAATRFEKYINPLYSLNTLTMFLDELQYFAKSIGTYTLGGSTWWINREDSTPVVQTIALDTLHVERLLFGGSGVEGHISDERIVDILQRLGCQIHTEREVTIPSRRGPDDITNQADLIEEIARIYGFDSIGSRMYEDVSRFVPYSQSVQRQRAIEDILLGAHFDQIETYPWLHERWHSYIDTDHLYTLTNPLAPEQACLRSVMWPSMVEVAEKNSPLFDTYSVFDIGKTRQQGREVKEHVVLSCMIWEKHPRVNQHNPFLVLKGLARVCMDRLQAKGKIDILPTEYKMFHPKQQLIIHINQHPVGALHTIHPALLEKSKLPTTGQLSILELDLTALERCVQPIKYGTAANYTTLQDQIVRRDLSFVLPLDQDYGVVTDAVASVKEIQQLEVFDLYTGEHIPAGEKSIALRIQLQGSIHQPLTTEEINAIMDKAIAKVEHTGARLRDK